MSFRIIPFLAIFCIGCRTASKTAQVRALAENNKDVVVLSHLIRDHMRKTRSISFTLAEIVNKDSLGRISNCFSKLEVGHWSNPFWRGGIAVYFKFSSTRNGDSIELTGNEKIPWKVKTKREIGQNEAQLAKKFDGEIRFLYPERHFFIQKIIVKRVSN